MSAKTYTKDQVIDIATRVAETIIDRYCDYTIYSDTIEEIVKTEMEG